MTTQSREDITTELITFVRESFLNGDPEDELEGDTPLLELGILNSLNTALLIAHVGQEFGIQVPLTDVTAETFKSVRSLSDVVYESLSKV